MPSFLERCLGNNGPFRVEMRWHSAAAFARNQIHLHSHKCKLFNHSPTHTHMHTLMWENWNQQRQWKALITAGIRQNVSRAVQHQTIWGLCFLSSPYLLPSLPSHLYLPQRFGVLQTSLAPYSLRPTSLSAAESIFEDNLRCAAPWWLGFDAQLHLQFQPRLDLPGTDSQLVSGHRYLTRKSAPYTVYIYNWCPGWPALKQSRRTLLHLCQFMRRKMTELSKRPQSILEGFCITIFTFNEMLHSMQIYQASVPIHRLIHCLFIVQKNPQTHFQHRCLPAAFKTNERNLLTVRNVPMETFFSVKKKKNGKGCVCGVSTGV